MSHAPSGQEVPQHGAAPPMRRQITPEEFRVLTECSRDAFWRRSVPFSVVLCGAVAFASRRKFINPKSAFGLWPKYTVAVFSGYIIGKLSYVKECNRRLMQVRGPRHDGNLDAQAGNVLAEIGADGNSRYQPDAFGSHLERESHSSEKPPEFSGDSYYEGSPLGNRNTESQNARRSTSYDELRRENRADYERSQRRAPQRGAEPNFPFSRMGEEDSEKSRSRQGTGSEAVSADRSVKRNKYGDAFE